MLRFLNNLTFRTLVLSISGALLLLFWIMGYHTWSSWRTYQINTVAMEANTVADRIISAAGLQALERGVTASALSAGGAASGEARARIADLRTKSKALWKEAEERVARIESSGFAGPGMAQVYRRAVEAYARLDEARGRVDASLSGTAPSIEAPEWIAVATATINSAAALRLATVSSDYYPPQITIPNLTAKHNIWLASEYAGRERATVAPILNSNAPATPQQMALLKSYRQVVDENLAHILSMRDVPGVDARIVAAIDTMKKVFLGEFEQTRKTVYEEMGRAPQAEGGRHYSLSGAEWIGKSTTAIDTLLAVAEAYSQVNDEKVRHDAQIAQMQTIGYVVLFIGIILVSVVTGILFFNKLRHLDKLRDSMREFATGEADLTRRLVAQTTDEIGQTSLAFNAMMDNLRDIIAKVQQSTIRLGSAADDLSGITERTNAGIDRQRTEINQVATAMNEMAATAQEVARNAQQGAEAAHGASASAQNGTEVVTHSIERIGRLNEEIQGAVATMRTLEQDSQGIGAVLDVIRGIAEQTNLLALNAAIEAARAGEQGRGFAVVADEVRSLANRTQQSTREIQGMIERLQTASREAAQVMERARHQTGNAVDNTQRIRAALDEINAEVGRISDLNNLIASAAQEQSSVAEEINRNVTNISDAAEQNADGAHRTAASAEGLTALSQELKALVGRFKV